MIISKLLIEKGEITSHSSLTIKAMSIIKTSLLLLTLIVLSLSSCGLEEELTTETYSMNSETTEFVGGSVFHSGIEGPAVDKHNNLFVVNYLETGTIGKVTHQGNTILFATLPPGSIGNGQRFYKSKMYLTDYVKHKIYCILENGSSYVYSSDEGMNQPNDLTMAMNGQLFCSDPNWSNSTGSIWTVAKEDSILVEIKLGLGLTNGIELSPDDKYLYVGESKSVSKSKLAQVSRFKVNWNTNPASLGQQVIFHIFDNGDVDGMRCDEEGNLFVARPAAQEIAVLNCSGELIHTVKTIGKNPTNLAFGGQDGRTVYVTVKDTKNIEQFNVKYPGRSLLIP
jgi:gluconolactonase